MKQIRHTADQVIAKLRRTDLDLRRSFGERWADRVMSPPKKPMSKLNEKKSFSTQLFAYSTCGGSGDVVVHEPAP